MTMLERLRAIEQTERQNNQRWEAQRMKTKVRAIVRGFNRIGKPFELTVDFELVFPKGEERQYYGTGCYLIADHDSGLSEYVDVRYSKTTDIFTLAETYIKTFWHGRVKEIQFN